MLDQVNLDRLHPELKPFVNDRGPPFGLSIVHPFVGSTNIDRFPSAIDQANEAYRSLSPLVTTAWANEDWGTYIVTHRREWRLNALLEIVAEHDGDLSRLWPWVRYVWDDAKEVWHNADDWREIWSTPCAYKRRAMNRNERAKLKRLPAEFAVWRGASNVDGVRGFSWTVDYEKAVWFAGRFSGGYIARGTVLKKDVLAYLNERKEKEIVVLPENVQQITVTLMEARGDCRK